MRCEFSVFDVYHDGDSLWFTAVEYNALYRRHLKGGGLEYIGSFPNERFYQWRLYASVHFYENKLYFIPCSACEIGVYDIDNGKFSKINIGIDLKDNDVSDIRYGKKFASAFIVKDELIMLPCCYDKVISYDLKSGEIHEDGSLYDSLWGKYAKSINCPENAFYVCWNAKRIDNYNVVFDLHSNANGYVIYDLIENTWQDYEAGNKSNSYNYCEYAGGEVLLYDDSKMLLVCQSIDNGRYEEYRLPTLENETKFSNMFLYEDDVYFLLHAGEKMLKFSLKKRKFEIVDELSDKYMSFASVFKIYNGSLILYDVNRHSFLDNKNGELIYYPCDIDEKILLKLRLKSYMEHKETDGNIFFEDDNFDLCDYLACIKNDSSDSLGNANNEIALNKNYGKRILEAV